VTPSTPTRSYIPLNKWTSFLPLLVFAIAFAVRLIVLLNTAIINPDGVIYIYQAKALYFKEYENITSCGINYLSLYPILIALMYNIVPDWSLSAHSVSLIFGLGTIIFIFLISRVYFDVIISSATALFFSLNPIFIRTSIDIIKDPIYCFFAAIGIYLFILGLSRQKAMFFSTSSFSLLLASWSRIEGITTFVISAGFLIFCNRKNRVKSLLFFSTPLIIAFAASIFEFSEIKSILQKHSRLNLIYHYLLMPYQAYLDIRNEIHEIMLKSSNGTFQDFLKEARSNIWLISLGVFSNRFSEAVFFPFLPFFVVGFIKHWKTQRKEIGASYLMLLIIFGALVIYFYMASTWTLEIRRFIIILIPSCLIFATGVLATSKYMASKVKINNLTALCIVACFILTAGLLKNIKPREADKLVFKQISQFIVDTEGNEKPIQISASLHTQRWISYYANQNYPGLFCPEYTDKNCWELFSESTCEGFVNHLEREHLQYFLWTEHRCASKSIDISCIDRNDRLERLGQWTHRDTGRMVLYKVVSP